MQQKTRRFAIMVGGGLLSVAGIVTGACSTDNGTTPTPGFDAGRDAKGGGQDGDPLPGDDGGGGGDAGPDCSAAPKPPNKDNPPGPFCFSAVDGGRCNSSNDEVCCSDAKNPDGGFAPATCE